MKNFITALVVSFYLITTTFTPAPIHAQAAPAPAAEGAKVIKPQETFWDIMKDAGVAVWVCVVLSIVVLGLIIESFMKFRVPSLVPEQLYNQIKAEMAYGNYQNAWQLAHASKTYLGKLVAAGLERIGRGKEATEFTLEETSTQQAVILKTNINYLSVIGVVAPMIGLTGTVIGMIEAFKTLSASGIADPAALSGAIGRVLLATAAGLIVAIPGFVFYYVFKAMSQTAILIANSMIFRLFEDIPYDQIYGLTIGERAQASTQPDQVYSQAAPTA
ncbi:MAG: MotA/TolQ/ExbB proton channel family protein [Methylacidiphilales bacterium]|nr:MotA/TolQ/ExbB proton channel family protein [Candidatus Methylacidiphilales bacterium]MDW8349337.1 MotA/TolQ/ExbB proton channel family protein [Verrucomicrobiae bacterium]